MRFVKAAVIGFAVASAVILFAMLIGSWLWHAQPKLWTGAGIASGCGLWRGATAQWKMSRPTRIALAGVLVGLGAVAGMWFS